jgi:hypothetical protein
MNTVLEEKELKGIEELDTKWQIRDSKTGKRLLTDFLEKIIVEIPKAPELTLKDNGNGTAEIENMTESMVYTTEGEDYAGEWEPYNEETIKALEGYIDIYLPDFKYFSSELSGKYSSCPDYFAKASKAIAEMYNQKSSALIEAVADMPASGMIIRHLVLPGCTQDSKNVLSWIADNISTNVHISLMSQYFPPQGLQLPDQLGRCITQEEYNDVVEHLYEIGFHKGWVQDYNSDKTYKPDFSKTEAFETNK